MIDGPYYAEDDSADVAVFRVKSKDLLMPGIPLGYHTNNNIDDNSFVLQDAVIIGYPPIPFTVTPNQVVASGQVSAVIDVWHSKYAHFIVSAMARGGFSGGVALAEDGRALGVITESLVMNDGLPELGYMSVIGIEAAVDIIKNIYPSIGVHDSSFVEMETLVHIKLVEPDLKVLNSRIHSASIYIYDDDRDLFGELYCADSAAAKIALAAFDAVCAIDIYDSDKAEDSGNYVFYMLHNPPARELIEAANSTKDALMGFGYEVASLFINSWQLKPCPPLEESSAMSTVDREELLKRDDDLPF
ncbi:serine protease [Pseudomonas syringae]|nr:serine protease [Pseudomonas syringae]